MAVMTDIPKNIEWVQIPTIPLAPIDERSDGTKVWDDIVKRMKLDTTDKRVVKFGKTIVERIDKLINEAEERGHEQGYWFRRTKEFVRGVPGHPENDMGM